MSEVEGAATATALRRHTLAITSIEAVAAGVVAVTLSDPDGTPLPGWTPGAHIDIELGPGLVRQYSLCGDPADSSRWTVAVRLATEGRGGSRYVHEELSPGHLVRVAGPRQHFPLEAADGQILLVAGGIGITPLLVMAEQLQREGAPFTLVYFGRDLKHMAFMERVRALSSVTVVARDSDDTTLTQVLAEHSSASLVYGCGPSRMLDELADLIPADRLRTETFDLVSSAPEMSSGDVNGPAQALANASGEPTGAGNRPFEVQIGHDGPAWQVPADRTLLDVLLEQGVDLLWSCREGNCASCEVQVLEGEPDHRDVILTESERAAGDVMFPCVSRAKCSRLVIEVP